MRKLLCVIWFLLLNTASFAQEWKAYFDSTQFYWARDWPKTIELLEKSREIVLADYGIYDGNYVTIISDLGVAYSLTRDYDKAELFLQKTLDIKKQLYSTDHEEYLNALLNLAGLKASQGKNSEAIALYEQIIRTSGATGSSLDNYRTASKYLGRLYEAERQWDKALEVYQAPMRGAEDSNLIFSYEMLLGEGRVNRKISRFDVAEDQLSDALRFFEELYQRDPETYTSVYAETLNEVGLLNEEKALFREAEVVFLKANELLKNQPDRYADLFGESLNNLASLYQRLGIYDEALRHMTASWNLCYKNYGTNSVECATIKNNMASIYLEEGRVDIAIQTFNEVIRAYSQTIPNDHPLLLNAVNNLATAYAKAGRTDAALSEIDKALNYPQNKKTLLYGTLMANKGLILTQMGEFKKATQFYKNALAIKQDLLGGHSIYLKDIENNFALNLLAINRYEEAQKLFLSALNKEIKFIKYVFANLSESEKISAYNSIKRDFERFNTLAVQFAKDNPDLLKEMFNKQFIIKGLLFHSQKKVQQVVMNSSDSTLLDLYNDLRQTRQLLARYYQLPESQLGDPLIIDSLERSSEKLQKGLALRTSESVFKSLQMEDYQWRDVQQALKENEALVEFIRFRKYDSNTNPDIINNGSDFGYGFTDSIYYAAIITTAETVDHPKLVVMKEGKNMESRFLSYYKNALKFEVEDINSYKYYWQPIEPQLRGKDRIYISNDGAYHKINLNILRDPRNGEHLITRHDINLIPNPSSILNQRTNKLSKAKTAWLFGDPRFNEIPVTGLATTRNSAIREFSSLPETRKEVKDIAQKLQASGWRTEVFLGNDATEENVSRAEAPEILHLATHGYFSNDVLELNSLVDDNSLFSSGLVFTGANKQLKSDTLIAVKNNNGILTAFEAMNMFLYGTDLVVLSACETGLGEIVNGEGVYGLQRSFLAAGANSVMISLWKVEDKATMDLMRLFYDYYLNGLNKRAALRKAQIELSKKYPSPRRWGSFIVIGT